MLDLLVGLGLGDGVVEELQVVLGDDGGGWEVVSMVTSPQESCEKGTVLLTQVLVLYVPPWFPVELGHVMALFCEILDKHFLIGTVSDLCRGSGWQLAK